MLDRTGRIDLLDPETLEFVGSAGHLPHLKTLFRSKHLVTPKDLLAYEIKPISLGTDKKYGGIFVAALSRESTAMSLAVFDKKGKLIKTDYTKAHPRILHRHSKRDIPSSKAIYFQVPWAPVATTVKYLLENLQPPILSIASYFTAYSFEASSGHRALFILPNSFVGMLGREVGENYVERFFLMLLLILPSIILSLILAGRVCKNATIVGLSSQAKLYWLIGTILFGLSAYITYQLTRPKITLVTCPNCGKLRRPDMARCHRCGSKWLVPELTPPLWRVIDGQSES